MYNYNKSYHQAKLAVFSLLHVSSNKESKVSSVYSLFFLSASISYFTLLTTSLSISKIDYSDSSLFFFS